ncbi:MAG: hypothetical protein ACPLXA_00380 [Moorellaceae bacterium]
MDGRSVIGKRKTAGRLEANSKLGEEKKMKLLELRLRNFKGIREFCLQADGQNVDIYGDNATGKTTVFDAFCWLLFDKDSLDRKDFEIKTLDPSGQPLHGFEHEVEAVLEVDGKQITLRKVFSEKWQKKRGSATPVFTGHTTDYFINGIPVKKNEYEAKIAEICPEQIFKLLTSPLFFNEQLHWQKRREILLDICGDISDEEVIASDKSLSRLAEILKARKLEKHRKLLLARRAEINKELEKIPVRIDEVEHSLPDTSKINTAAVAAELATIREKMREKQAELVRIETGGELAEQMKRLRELESELLEAQNSHRAAVDAQIREKRAEFDRYYGEVLRLRAEIKQVERDLDFNKKAASDLQAKIASLRQAWQELNRREFVFEQDTVCPTCGQPLPEEKLEEAREKALAEFNHDKAERLEAIAAEGKMLKEKLEELTGEISSLEVALECKKEELLAAEDMAAKAQEEMTLLRQQAETPAGDTAFAEKLAEKRRLEQVIAKLKGDRLQETQRVKDELAALEEEARRFEAILANVQRYADGQKRIEELKRQERELAAEYERLEEELYLTEQFIRTKVKLLEEKINSRFKLARFKLFDVQINGAITECCETMYQGVPYSSLNHGAQINLGLDVINTLSEHYGFTAPIFVDNAEAVTQLIPTRGQLIRLIVSEKDKSLRVEVAEEKRELKEAV